MELNELFNQFINKDLIDVIISNPKSKSEEASKIKVRPVLLKDTLSYQVTKYIGNQVFHENYQELPLRNVMTEWITNQYKQAQFTAKNKTASVLSGKKGNLTIKCKNNAISNRIQAPLAHNRSKKYILEEGIAVPFLVDLGIMTGEGKIVNSRYDKFRQINRFLEFIEDVLPSLNPNTKQTIIDFGCGKSYLTFAMYYYLKVLKHYDVEIIGLDLKKDVIEHCQKLAKQYGYEELHFLVGDIASYNDVSHVNMVVTLHACDTATDYALYKAVKWGADVILSVPCCQHEANAQIANEQLQDILKYGIIKERMSALITDGIRANLLEQCGYKTQILEFIDMEHNPKNLLIRGVKDGRSKEESVEQLEQFLSLDLTLHRLLKEDHLIK